MAQSGGKVPYRFSVRYRDHCGHSRESDVPLIDVVATNRAEHPRRYNRSACRPFVRRATAPARHRLANRRSWSRRHGHWLAVDPQLDARFAIDIIDADHLDVRRCMIGEDNRPE